MLIGRQENVVTVDFMPGENLESLIKNSPALSRR
nr:hypothetical protein [Sodalis ligni]